MKLINYKLGYNNTFDCSIHGTITMTRKEWNKVYTWLNKQNKLFDLYGGTFMKDIFRKDCLRAITTPKGQYINIRVTATEALSTKYHLNNYKRGNYQLCILH